jgi:anaerobic selenocysteine-containing dehydrogenase
MDRRRFLKVTAVTGTTAALTACGNPEQQLVRFIPDDAITPGIAQWKPSICPLCAAGCGVQARVMDGDAEVLRQGTPGVVRAALVKKLEGDPDHAPSRGRLCVRGQAAVQVTYHPDRLVAPMKRTGERGTGQFTEITWDEAIATLASKLDAARGSGPSAIAYVGRPHPGRRTVVVERFLAGLGAAGPIWHEPFDDDVLRRANAIAFGRHQLPTFDLEHARLVVNFGSDILGTWNAPLAHGVAYGRMRRGAREGALWVQVEPRVSQTGASADLWLAIRPGTEGAVALGLAHLLMRDGHRAAPTAPRALATIDGWSRGLPDFTPEAVQRASGLSPERLAHLAHDLTTRTPAVAIIGGQALAHTNGLAQALAVNALNELLGAVGTPGGVHFTPTSSPRPAVRDLADVMRAGTPAVLVVDGANPVHALPPSLRAGAWLRQVPFIASVGSFLDDTSSLADLLLPDHSFLESWVDADPESGALEAERRSAGPAMRPLYDTRATGDVLLQVAAALAQPLDPPMPWASFEAVVQDDTLTLAPPPTTTSPNSPSRWSPPSFDGAADQFPLHFLPYASQAFGDGATAHLPWLQELPDPLTTAMWSTWVEIHPATGARHGIADGDIVAITSAHGTVEAPAVLSPGIGPDAVAMPAGQGHGTYTRYASGRGANPFAVLAPTVDTATGVHAWAATRVRIARAAAADGRLILFGGATRERPEHLRGRS